MSEVNGWLDANQDRPFVQLEMPMPIAEVVAPYLETVGFVVKPEMVNEWDVPRAMVVPQPHLLETLLMASAMTGMPFGESLKDCPECRQGKHDNCPGDTWDDRPGHDELATCPCYARGHRPAGELPSDVPDAQTLRRLTGFQRHPLTDWPPAADTP